MKGYTEEQRRVEHKNYWGPVFNPLYMQDLEVLLKIQHDLNNIPMSDSRRDILETSLEAIQVILDLYAPEDHR